MRFQMPTYPCEFEIPDDWLADVSLPVFRGGHAAYQPAGAAVLIPLADIEPPYRVHAHPKDWRGFDRERFLAVLRRMVSGDEIDPVPVLELPAEEIPTPPYRYRIRNGFHRYYASIVAGFGSLPGAIARAIDRQAYVNEICGRYAEAVHVPFDADRAAANQSEIQRCHENVDAWVAKHPEDSAVRGWVTWYPVLDGVLLTAHSVVRGADGELFDITPLGDESGRAGMKFVRHLADEATFEEMKPLNHFKCIICVAVDVAAPSQDFFDRGDGE